MKQGKALLQIGSKVIINEASLEKRLSTNLLSQIKQNNEGKVIGYKITDGTQIGIILELKNGMTCWFFPNEICQSDINSEKFINLESSGNTISKKRRPSNEVAVMSISEESKILYILNPINFTRWLIYSIKDVI